MKKFSPHLFRPRLATSDGSAPGSSNPGAGHADNFRTLILPHLDGAYNLARYLTRDPVLSEDVVQDAFVRAFRAFPQFRGESPRAWLFAIVRNCCRSAMSAQNAANFLTVHESGLSGKEARNVADRIDPELTPDTALIRRRQIAEIRASVEGIPEPFREAVILRDMEELSYREIAEVTGAAIGTVMSRLSRGRAMLAQILLSFGNDDGQCSRSVK
ncbi:MAG: sigma-70 family RNA polymerase sigma factor [Sphingomicrobium sp.]|nr:sigma-70 family RNA polymerase sigma factor [Sphingomonadales bacterium]